MCRKQNLNIKSTNYLCCQIQSLLSDIRFLLSSWCILFYFSLCWSNFVGCLQVGHMYLLFDPKGIFPYYTSAFSFPLFSFLFFFGHQFFRRGMESDSQLGDGSFFYVEFNEVWTTYTWTRKSEHDITLVVELSWLLSSSLFVNKIWTCTGGKWIHMM